MKRGRTVLLDDNVTNDVIVPGTAGHVGSVCAGGGRFPSHGGGGTDPPQDTNGTDPYTTQSGEKGRELDAARYSGGVRRAQSGKQAW